MKSIKSFFIRDKYVCMNVDVHTSANVQVRVQMCIFVTFYTLTNTHTDSEETHFKLGASTQALTLMLLHVDFARDKNILA